MLIADDNAGIVMDLLFGFTAFAREK